MSYLGENIGKLGFGLMRLPLLEGGAIDVEQTKVMVDMFLEKDFTYFDTAYGYFNGRSEEAIKEALVDRYPREKFLLATKLPAWAAKTADDAKAMFTTSLKRTGAGYFDYYLLHNLGDDRIRSFEDFGIWEYVRGLKEKGLVKHIGFSFHDTAEKLDEILTAHPEAEFVQLQINYADWDSPTVQSKACYEVARRHGKPVIIMEPVKGGNLANPPKSVADIFKAANPDASVASWAIRFAASLEGIITVLSGMSDIAQMEDNLSTMMPFSPLTDAERKVISDVVTAFGAIPSVPCTGCDYCVKGCPQEIAIPGIFSAMNTRMVYGNVQGAKGNYMWATRTGGKASKCIECGHCESVCPQHIDIINRLKTAVSWFEE
ncbi:MAG: aldo/keto reductase [Christensenellales bacterium]|jgi:predicted aldo/keto reductase-like oxidoreductase